MFCCSTQCYGSHTAHTLTQQYPLVGTAMGRLLLLLLHSALATHGIVIVCLQLLQFLLLLLFLGCCVLYCVVFIRRNVRGEFVCFIAALNLMPHKVIA